MSGQPDMSAPESRALTKLRLSCDLNICVSDRTIRSALVLGHSLTSFEILAAQQGLVSEEAPSASSIMLRIASWVLPIKVAELTAH
jgi:hypothetical protein